MLEQLSPKKGSTKKRVRVGRGIGSGLGKTCGKGHKGQKTRSGDRRLPSWFEGGQTPLHKRVPKRGFRSPFKEEYSVINLKTLEDLFNPGDEINPDVLFQKGLVRKGRKLKILAFGEIKKPLKIKAHAFSKSAMEKITAAGGVCETIDV
ncbi:MAG: 50S ribosomal protein L15 [Aquificaceae bacterium]|nr:50S ribosomal protein L15 [Aquificaceae bacterium]MDW8237754.1 50S ribosomal protein L15 [Aquificaceae bacterium]